MFFRSRNTPPEYYEELPKQYKAKPKKKKKNKNKKQGSHEDFEHTNSVQLFLNELSNSNAVVTGKQLSMLVYTTDKLEELTDLLFQKSSLFCPKLYATVCRVISDNLKVKNYPLHKEFKELLGNTAHGVIEKLQLIRGNDKEFTAKIRFVAALFQQKLVAPDLMFEALNLLFALPTGTHIETVCAVLKDTANFLAYYDELKIQEYFAVLEQGASTATTHILQMKNELVVPVKPHYSEISMLSPNERESIHKAIKQLECTRDVGLCTAEVSGIIGHSHSKPASFIAEMLDALFSEACSDEVCGLVCDVLEGLLEKNEAVTGTSIEAAVIMMDRVRLGSPSALAVFPGMLERLKQLGILCQ